MVWFIHWPLGLTLKHWGDSRVAKITHLFYLDEELQKAIGLAAGDRLIWSKGKYSAFRAGHRLTCQWQAEVEEEGAKIKKTLSGGKFTMPDSDPIHGAIDLAEMFKLSARIMHGEKRDHIDEKDRQAHEWLLEVYG